MSLQSFFRVFYSRDIIIIISSSSRIFNRNRILAKTHQVTTCKPIFAAVVQCRFFYRANHNNADRVPELSWVDMRYPSLILTDREVSALKRAVCYSNTEYGNRSSTQVSKRQRFKASVIVKLKRFVPYRVLAKWHCTGISQWTLPIKRWRRCSFSTPLASTRRSPVAGPASWNRLPATIQSSDTLQNFKNKLKAHFFWWTISFSFSFISNAGALELDSMLRCLKN